MNNINYWVCLLLGEEIYYNLMMKNLLFLDDILLILKKDFLKEVLDY